MTNIEVNDIVKISDLYPGNALAVYFCKNHELTGTVIDIQNGLCEVNFGIGYKVYVHLSHLTLIAKSRSIPDLTTSID
jgi:hypothetical protein